MKKTNIFGKTGLSERIGRMGWKEFMGLDEVQVDQSPSGEGNALFYSDGKIQVSVDFKSKELNDYGQVIAEGHDDMTLWEDEKLAKELQKLVVEELERKN